ncbi:endogenous retrovirus group K member 6 Env polyprotein-like [Peromyscus californicus insignis]|uniref:endogenous retrovirus group K member 6 Env polyprotein-like n=1 Tax=Peromyscus californicus insignis TaxID=564181 RepID=UPI0022A7FC84|nr:endogenous retrovirus group K member 6 Env polyprotein-like [Peromyscus californicus insignis]
MKDRMRNRPYGFQTDSSGQRRRKLQKRKEKLATARLTQEMKKLTLKPQKLPTWTQLKHLATEAKALASQQCSNPPLEMLFVAMLSLIAVGPTTASTSPSTYWAYVPRPPLLHVVGWLDDETYKVLSNQTEIIGGFQDSDERASASSFINFAGSSDSLPICFALEGVAPPGCLSTSYRTFLTDAPSSTGQ